MAYPVSPQRNCKLLIAYSGTKFYGFQKTKMGPSVEEALQNALEKILQHPIQIQAASRTDRGVHAEGQVINFFTPSRLDLSKLYMSLRGLLPQDIAPLELTEAPLDFHPTLDTKGKEYHYFVCNTPIQIPFHTAYSWHVFTPLDLKQMQKGASYLIGTHNFSALSNLAYSDPVRTLNRIEIILEKGRLRFEIQGDNFLYKMVRNIVGTLVHIGCGKIPLEKLPFILEAGDRRLAGMTAPAHGLFLKRVFY